MIVQRFLNWCETAGVQERSAAARTLGEAWVEGHLAGEDRATGLAALGHFAADPSPKVRLALAEALAPSHTAPRRVVLALADDVDEIACRVVASSPVFLCADLVDLFAYGSPRLRLAIAGRDALSFKLTAAIVEIGEAGEVAEVLANSGADIGDPTLRRAAERFGDDAAVRGHLLSRSDLPLDVRQLLVLEVGRALSGMSLLRATVGERRIDKLILESCETATADMAADARRSDIPALVEHLRVSGQLSTAFLIRIVCAGQVDLFTAALVALCGHSERRVRSIVVEGRQAAFDALVKSCGLPDAAGPLLRTAIRMWKEIAQRHASIDLEAMPAAIMARLAETFAERRDEPGFEAVLTLLRRLESETVRRSARSGWSELAAA